MPFSFEISKPQNIKSTLITTRQKIINSGGTFSGDDQSGKFTGKGVEGIYRVGNSAIIITITQKPALYPAAAVKSAIENYFK
ncbi:MAG: hypothetical protein FWF92_09050 [Oscillospiraceae bacterium]|nr:hypothetical protein [Oscillospiraceae bacterium]